MGSPEDRLKHSRRRKNKIAKDLRTPKYKEKVIEEVYDRNKNKKINLEIEVELEDE